MSVSDDVNDDDDACLLLPYVSVQAFFAYAGTTLDNFTSQYNPVILGILANTSNTPLANIKLGSSKQDPAARKLLWSGMKQTSNPSMRKLLLTATAASNPTPDSTHVSYTITTYQPSLVSWRLGRPVSGDSSDQSDPAATSACSCELCVELIRNEVPVDPSSIAIDPPLTGVVDVSLDTPARIKDADRSIPVVVVGAIASFLIVIVITRALYIIWQRHQTMHASDMTDVQSPKIATKELSDCPAVATAGTTAAADVTPLNMGQFLTQTYPVSY